ncbi:MAG: DUF2339 domain-containing protein [Cytophagales bacterium]|nr:MAG: DUF2339 domain-containing protein [Cytophagales bacterium]
MALSDSEKEKKMHLLSEKLNNLSIVVSRTLQQIEEMRAEIASLQSQSFDPSQEKSPFSAPVLTTPTTENIQQEEKEKEKEKITPEFINNIITEIKAEEKKKEEIKAEEIKNEEPKTPTPERDWEDYVGTNLLSRIGIVMLIVSIAIFINYAVENNWISPLMRVLLGYVASGVLIGLSYYLRKKYETYSAILFAGGAAVMYLSNYLGHILYDIPNVELAFALMLLATVYTIFEATRYKQESIAIFGLIAAYAVPPLLSKSGGSIAIFWTYIALINVGVLVLSMRMQWATMRNAAFIITWFLFLAWTNGSVFDAENHTIITVFGYIYGFTFMAMLVFQYWQNPQKINNIINFFNWNTFFMFAVGFLMSLNDYSLVEIGEPRPSLAVFLLVISLALGVVTTVLLFLRKQSDAFINTILAQGLVLFNLCLFFLDADIYISSIAIAQACLMAYLGKPLGKFYLKATNALAAWGVLNMIFNWKNYQNIILTDWQMPVLNMSALLSLLLIAGLFFITYQFYKAKQQEYTNLFGFGALVLLFLLGIQEINYQFFYLYQKTAILVKYKDSSFTNYDYDLLNNRLDVIIGYGLLLLSAATWVGIKLLKSDYLYRLAIQLHIIAIFVFALVGTAHASMLLDNYITQKVYSTEIYFAIDNSYFNYRFVRYIALAVAVITMSLFFRNDDKSYMAIPKIYYVFLNLCIIIVLSYEILHFNILNSSAEKEALLSIQESIRKIGYTILWGIYSMSMIIWGIIFKRKLMRLAGFAIFGIVILKIFAFDLKYISTLSRIIVFFSIACIFLITAYLYNRYKHIILAEDQ